MAQVATLLGYGTATTAQSNQIGGFALLRMGTALKRDWWPNWMVTEQRAYAAAYSPATTYALNAIVWDGAEAYYQSLQAANQGNALTETAWWVKLTAIDAVIPFAQTGKTTIGTLQGAYFTEDNARMQSKHLGCVVQAGNVYITDAQEPAAPWLTFRRPLPVVTGETPDTVPDEWVPFIVQGAYGEMLRFEGKADSARDILAEAELLLEDAVIAECDQQGMVSRVRVAVPGAPIKAFVYRGEA